MRPQPEKPASAAPSPLREAFERIINHDAFNGSHVSIDRDRRGEIVVNIEPDWIGLDGLAFLVGLVRVLELSLSLTKDGLRLDEWDGDMVRRVQSVKDVLAAEREEGDDDAGE